MSVGMERVSRVIAAVDAEYRPLRELAVRAGLTMAAAQQALDTAGSGVDRKLKQTPRSQKRGAMIEYHYRRKSA